MTNTPSAKQVGITKPDGKRVEPTRCAVSNRDVVGKPHITHIGPDGQFVYVLAQYDHQWPLAAPAYGFPVEDSGPANDSGGFVLPAVPAKAESADAEMIFPSGENGAPFTSLRPVDAAKKPRASSPVTAPTPTEMPQKDGE